MARSARDRGRSRGARKPAEAPRTRARRGASAQQFRPSAASAAASYAGAATFLRLPAVAADVVPEVDVLLCGAPVDLACTFRPGARFAPRALREASALSQSFSSALGIDIYEELSVADGGDVPSASFELERALGSVSSRAEAIARSGVIAGFVGGDQSVTLAALRGLHRAKPRAVGMLHIDAQPDTALTPGSSGLTAASVMRVAVEEGLIRGAHTLQLGVRGPHPSRDDLSYAKAQGFEIVGVDEIKWDLHAAVSHVRKAVSRGALYVSIDVSALDPAYAPGTGRPLPGGINSWELQQLLRALVGAEIVGFDVVEIAPPYDHAGITAQLGVTVLEELLSVIADTRRSARPAVSSRGDSRRRSP